jgi:hypothetical protein
MIELDVVVQKRTMQLYQIVLFYKGELIGEYERSMLKHIERKLEEIKRASALLLSVYQERGPFEVRWVEKTREKEIRVDGERISTVPREFWGK